MQTKKTAPVATKTVAAKPVAPKLPESVPDAPKAEKPKRQRRPIAQRLALSIERLERRAKRLIAFYEGEEAVVEALTKARLALEFAATDARELPDTWTPARHTGPKAPREPIAVGSTVRIAKGVLAQYAALLGDDEGTDALNALTVFKYSEKHSVVKTPAGTRFAIATRLLRRV